MSEAEGTSASRKGLVAMIVISQVFGAATVVLIGVWMGKYLGGFAWDGSSREFNIHAVLMTLSMLYLYGSSAIVYRSFPNLSRMKVKILHAALQGLAFVGIVVGLIAVFEFHNAQNIPNMYSLHSWCGIICVVLFALQYIFGFVSFLFPGLREDLRTTVLPYHRFLGSVILVLAGGTVLSGITEKLIFSISSTYSSLPPAGLLANFAGISIIIFVVSVLYILNRKDWKRKSPEENNMLMQPNRD